MERNTCAAGGLERLMAARPGDLSAAQPVCANRVLRDSNRSSLRVTSLNRKNDRAQEKDCETAPFEDEGQREKRQQAEGHHGLLMLAGQDRIIDNRATRKFLEQIASPDKTVIEYPEAQHTLEFEPDRDQFIDDLLGWMERTIQPRVRLDEMEVEWP